ncbi:MAG: putative manganese transporter [Caldisericota bacterium]|nr:putative manganese transporter [Caldisericota bacterium]
MMEILKDALLETAFTAPFLFVIYVVLEFLEARWQQRIVMAVARTGKAGPALAALGGSIPQCGFSVMASALYTQRLISAGTIVAVYLSTSDEALPVILAEPGRAHLVLPLIGTKILLAAAGGYLVDLVMRRQNRRRLEQCQDRQDAERRAEQVGELHCSCNETKESCEHEHGQPVTWRGVLRAAVRHTLQVVLYLFVVSVLLGFAIQRVGQDNLSSVLLGNTMFQPVITAFFGLIPNCAASVAITELYLAGGLSFGSTVAGLGAAGGLGLLVLFKENHDHADTARIVAWVLAISIAAGMILQLVFP